MNLVTKVTVNHKEKIGFILKNKNKNKIVTVPNMALIF